MVLLASPCKTIRRRWQLALAGSCPTHEVADQIGLRQALTQYKPAVLLLDSELIRHGGTRQLLSLCQTSPDTRTILLTDDLNDQEGIAVLKAGARGYCAKTIASASLKKAVCAVKKGEIWIGRRLVSLLIESLVGSRPRTNTAFIKHDKPADSAAFLAALSPRQLDIASMIGTGEQNKIISSHLSISEKTVKAHLTNIFKKLGLSSRTQLALFVRQHHSIPKSLIKVPHLHPTSSSIENQGGV
ncbi:MAG TPA: response regulator transcription factor [Candidatus Binatia bacterium]|jgi:two-component system nitrate/nitrite response regulator NarL